VVHLRLAETLQVEWGAQSRCTLALRDGALLARLAVDGPTHRDRLAAWMWSDSPRELALAALRQRLYTLRRVIGDDLAKGKILLGLTDQVTHDLTDDSPLLADAELPELPRVDAWLRDQRALRMGRARERLLDQSRSLEAAGNLAEALAAAQELLRMHPLSEASHRRVIRLHYLMGDRALALAAFDGCEHVLKHEVGTRPAAETLALLQTVESLPAPTASNDARRLPEVMIRPPALVGRDRQLRALQRAWDAHQVACVRGEAGIGKSRLLGAHVAAHPGAALAAARPGDALVPFATLRRALHTVGERGGMRPLDPQSRQQMARILPELSLPEDPPDGLRLPLRHAVIAWLRSSSDLQGLMLDDLHFADDASVELLQALTAEPALIDFRWVLAYRPAEVGDAVQRLHAALAERALLREVDLPSLDVDEVAAVLDQLQLGDPSHVLAPGLLKQTGGNPLFLLETVKQAWVEQRSDWPKPQSVEHLLDKRIARLGGEAATLARVAALAGVDFSLALAAVVLDVPALALADRLNELEVAQVLKGTAFAHDLMFDAVLRSVPLTIKQHVHGQIAHWLESHDSEPARIAEHWVAAHQARRAAPWLERAAMRAAAQLRNLECLGFLERKAEIEAAEGHLDLAFKTQQHAIALDIDRDAARGAVRLARLEAWASDDTQRCEAAFERALLAGLRLESDAEVQLLEVLAQARQLGHTRIEMECRVMLVYECAYCQRLDEAQMHAQACQEWIYAHGRLKVRGELLYYQGNLHRQLGRMKESLSCGRQAVAIARELGYPAHVSTVLAGLALSILALGQPGGALPLLLEANELADRHELPPPDFTVKLTLAETFLRLGRYREALAAESVLRAAVRGRVADGADHLGAWVQGAIWVQLGQWHRLDALIDQLSSASQSRNPQHQLNLLRLRWMRSLGMGKPERGCLSAAIELIESAKTVHSVDLLADDAAYFYPPDEGLLRLQGLLREWGQRGLDGHVVTAHVRAAQLATGFDPDMARRHALSAADLVLHHGRHAAGLYHAEVFLQCGRALQAAGDMPLARDLLRQGKEWVQHAAQHHVPDAFRDDFLQRNRINAALLAAD
jgi:DNA-binding SARP family transcriptional activator